jgi:hypothetical protein
MADLGDRRYSGLYPDRSFGDFSHRADIDDRNFGRSRHPSQNAFPRTPDAMLRKIAEGQIENAREQRFTGR